MFQAREAVRAGIVTFFSACTTWCLDPFTPPVGTHPLDPPAAYERVWQLVEACSGLQGDFHKVHWFAVPQSPFRCGEMNCMGMCTPPHSIYLAERAIDDSTNAYWTVRHEMLHDLLGGGDDQSPFFAQCDLLRRSTVIQSL